MGVLVQTKKFSGPEIFKIGGLLGLRHGTVWVGFRTRSERGVRNPESGADQGRRRPPPEWFDYNAAIRASLIVPKQNAFR